MGKGIIIGGNNDNQGMLGEVRMFDLSVTGAVTKASLQGQGWAICDGTTPAAQGIANATIETTRDLQHKFIRMSNDESSGGSGGSATHNHMWFDYTAAGGGGNGSTFNSGGTSTAMNTLDSDLGNNLRSGIVVGTADPDGGEQTLMITNDVYTDKIDSSPEYIEMAYFIKVR